MALLTLRFTRGAVLLGALVLVTTAVLNTAPPAAGAQLDGGNGSGMFDVPKTGHLVTPADCWVTGDLVGDGNPTQVYAALCSPLTVRRAETL